MKFLNFRYLIPKILFTSLLIGHCSFAFANALERSLAARDYSGAIQQSRKLPPDQIIATLTPIAQKDLTPAQWILADAYWRKKDNSQAIQWAYIAVVGTQLDTATGCRSQTMGMSWMLNAFQPIFREARQNPYTQSIALKKAISYHQAHQNNPLPLDYGWICRVNASLKKETWNERSAPPESLKRIRTVELKKLTEKIGAFEEQIIVPNGEWDIVK